MKRMIMTALLGLSLTVSFEQTTGEWLQQKKTRLKYLAQQVGALEMYLVDIKKGYQTVKGGLAVIDGLKRGDFGLHQGYIESLSSVDAAVGHSSTLEAIFMLTKQMTDVITAMRSFQSSPLMHPDERMYITAVTGNLLQKSAADIEDLTLFVRSGEAAMSEENRMQHIGALYTAAKDRHAFLLHFRQGIQLLQRSRAKEKQENSDMNILYGIK